MKAVKQEESAILHENLDCDASQALPEAVLRHIAKSDSLYLATAYLPSDEEESYLGMNHRGGQPGFVQVDPVKRNVLYMPDFSGNRMMQVSGLKWHVPTTQAKC